ncbi:vacuolar protein sorting-associated protein 11 homolog isoform X1 [Sturnira hondurensis]|uniref:vacuolar protein sorting-associated protein 11 homolog isoform X1 n=2 Tax=Sturnira hondurensis TaxID=192404 RepID=UPI001879F6F0|nr:vacuolar protein sorting-associated protein 11 homolog isoform X1 [Sturnira hondurensis]XP_036923458.1 vacuolar protein sorting-associated protein 11 homolog isoform X1 [Sturnira hondurensis]XP_036923460.1 vacuolar protein sorting-associated protein 11 homolog isoform X1 [Sturnira hondurensis]
MAAYLQWRRFVFFDKELVKEPLGNDGPAPGAAANSGSAASKFLCLPPGITVCDSGRGSIVFGDMEGQIWFLPRSLQLTGFQAYKLRVTHLYQLKQHNILASVGEDEQGINPLVKIWNLEKRDGGNPLCTRIFPAIPGTEPTVVSCLTVHENLNFMAIGFTDGSVTLNKGDITRDRHSKTQILHKGNYPVTGLAFRQAGKTTHLFVVTTENVQSYIVSGKDCPRVELDTHGCGLRCSALSDPSQDLQFIVAGDECVYLYQPDERGPCFAFEGHKLIAHWFRGYLIIVSCDRKVSPKSEFTSGDPQSSDKQILNIYDLCNKFIAYSAVFEDIVDVLAEWGSLYVLTRDGRVHALQEKDTQTKLEMLFKKNLFEMAINLAKSQHLDSDGLAHIFMQYGDHLYSKGNHDGAVQQYIRTIGKLEPSYVIRKFLDAQRIHNLTAYLQTLHRQSLANADHTTLLLNCYTKLKDSLKLEEFIKTKSESEVHFDVETAIRVLRQAGYYSQALYLAEDHAHHEWYLKIQLEDIKNYQEALRYIGKLPFEQAESNMKRYGKILMHHIPEQMTQLLKGLCTNYQPSPEGQRDREASVCRANSEEFIPIFANNPRELKAFLEHMSTVQPNSPQGIYDTLLELRLQNWAHEKDSQVKEKLHEEAISLLKSGHFCDVFDKALVLCQMHDFQDGVLYLYEQGKLYQQIMHYHMQHEQYRQVIAVCECHGEQEPSLWEQALSYFARKEEDCKEYVAAVLKHIENKNLMPPLLVVQTLAHNSTATLSVIRDYLVQKLQKQSQQIAQDELRVRRYREETTRIRQEILELKTSPKIFQKTKCSICNSALELPSVHFLCGHSFHQHCFESYSESDADCPTCLPENRKVMDMIRIQEQKRDLHDQFQHQLKCSNDSFSVIADYFGRGVFNKLTLLTDPPMARLTGSLESGLQRDLLVHSRRGT